MARAGLPPLAAYVLTLVAAAAGVWLLSRVVFPQGLASVPACDAAARALLPRFVVSVGSSSPSPSADAAAKTTSAKVALLWRCLHDPAVTGAPALVLFSVAWIVLKAVALPGSIVFCFALGGLLPLAQAQALATVCETLGGVACYGLSGAFGGPLLERFFPRLLARARREMRVGSNASRMQTFWAALFARQTPLIPNWFVNAASPIVGVPLDIFIVTTVLGSQAALLLGVSTGAMLRAMGEEVAFSDTNVVNDPDRTLKNMGVLFALQFVALVPMVVSKWRASSSLKDREGGVKQD